MISKLTLPSHLLSPSPPNKTFYKQKEAPLNEKAPQTSQSQLTLLSIVYYVTTYVLPALKLQSSLPALKKKVKKKMLLN